MRTTRVSGGLLVAGAGALLSLPAAAQAPGYGAAAPPTVLERVEERLEKSPELRKVFDTRPSALDRLDWMVGSWTLTFKTFGTGRTKEKVESGTRETAWELDRRWLVSRDTIPGKHGVELFGYDGWRQMWVRQYNTSWGRGGMQVVLGTRGWDGPVLPMEGTLYFFGEPAEVNFRLTKLSDDEYLETYEEKLGGGGVVRPVLEIRFVRVKAGKGPAEALPKM